MFFKLFSEKVLVKEQDSRVSNLVNIDPDCSGFKWGDRSKSNNGTGVTKLIYAIIPKHVKSFKNIRCFSND